MQAFDTFKVVPPGIGIVHQVNLEYLARGVHQKDGVYYPDTLVGTDSHTTMINGIGVVGWGVGGIEAEAGMLGQPVYFLTPDVVGVHLKGRLREGVTATDLVLTVTELLRKAKVVGKFVEFFGEGAASLAGARSRDHRQHGARIRRDDGLLRRRRQDGRLPDQDRAHADGDRSVRGLFPGAGPVRHAARRARSTTRRRSSSIWPRSTASLAGPKRPQDRIELPKMKASFDTLFSKPIADNGFGQPPDKLARRYPVHVAAAPERALERRQAAPAGQRPAAQRGRDGRQPSDAGSASACRGRSRSTSATATC